MEKSKSCGYCNKSFSTWKELLDHTRIYHRSLESAVVKRRIPAQNHEDQLHKKPKIRKKVNKSKGNKTHEKPLHKKSKNTKRRNKSKRKKKNQNSGIIDFEPLTQKQKDEIKKIRSAKKKLASIPKNVRRRGLNKKIGKVHTKTESGRIVLDDSLPPTLDHKGHMGSESQIRMRSSPTKNHEKPLHKKSKIKKRRNKSKKNEEQELTELFDDFGNLKSRGSGPFSVNNLNFRKVKHSVRGHWRVLESGKRVWVKAHFRGDR